MLKLLIGNKITVVANVTIDKNKEFIEVKQPKALFSNFTIIGMGIRIHASAKQNQGRHKGKGLVVDGSESPGDGRTRGTLDSFRFWM